MTTLNLPTLNALIQELQIARDTAAALPDYQNAHIAISSENEQLKENMVYLQAKATDIAEENSKFEAKINELKNQLFESRSASLVYDRKSRAMDEERESLQSTQRSLQSMNDGLNDTIIALNDKIISLEGKNKALAQDLEKAKAVAALSPTPAMVSRAMEDERETFEITQRALQDMNVGLNDTIISLNETIITLEEKIRSLTNDLEEARVVSAIPPSPDTE